MKYLDLGVFYAETTLPLGKEESFYENEIEGFFEKYKQLVHENSPNFNSEVEFYVPKSFWLWGAYDLGIFALMDDLSPSAINFHPGSLLMKPTSVSESLTGDGMKNYSENFKYKVTTGLIPLLPGEAAETKTKSTNVFFKQKITDSNFFAVCRFKINNSILIGNGSSLKEKIYLHINSILKKRSAEKKQSFDSIILEQLGYNDFSVVFCSSSIERMAQLIIEIRELKCSDFLSSKEMVSLKEHSLFESFRASSKKFKAIWSDELFSSTYSTYGYNKTNQGFIMDQDANENPVKLHTSWIYQPGRLLQSIADVTHFQGQQVSNNQINILPGHSDFSLSKEVIGLKDYLVLSEQFTQKERDKFDFNHNITGVRSIPQIDIPHPSSVSGTNEKKENLSGLTHYLKDLKYDKEDLKCIYDNLREMGASKIVIEKVLNVFMNYNLGISDVNLYGYFVELKGFLERFIDNIEYANSTDKGFQKQKLDDLDILCDTFEIAFRNRYYQSHALMEVTDFNTEFNGGVQRLLSGIDAIYSTINNSLGDAYELPSITFVSGRSNTVSNKLGLRLNYFHLFQPSILISAIFKESANYIFERPSLDEDAEFYKLKDKVPILVHNFQDFFKNDLGKGFERYEKFFSDKYFKYIFADLISFNSSYGRNLKLFTFWFWTNTLQISSIYDAKGNVSESAGIKLILRRITIMKVIGISQIETHPHEKLSKCWQEHYLNLYYLVNHSFEAIRTIKPWFQDINRISRRIASNNILSKQEFSDFIENKKGLSIRNSLSIEEAAKVDVNSKVLHKVSSLVSSLNQSLNTNISLETLIKTHCSIPDKSDQMDLESVYVSKFNRLILSNFLPKVKRKLSDGESFVVGENVNSDEAYAKLYVTLLCHAYLELIADMAGYRSKEFKFQCLKVKKDRVGQVRKTVNKNGPNTENLYPPDKELKHLIDPSGGILFRESSTKRKHLRARFAFMASSIDFSERTKAKYFEQILELSDVEFPN